MVDTKTLLEMLHVAERLKDTPRHCVTSRGRRESVAEHSWRLALLAFWVRDAFPDLDMDKVIAMCLIHDLGEAFTGDIPVFDKTDADSAREDALLGQWVESLPCPVRERMQSLYAEMHERQTDEARLYKALDGLEALIQHNEAPLSSWAENEYDLQMTYADDRVGFSAFLTALREQVRADSLRKIQKEKNPDCPKDF